METEAESWVWPPGLWEIDICVVCKFPVEYCLCRKIHAGGD